MSAINITQVQVLVRLFQNLSFLLSFLYLSLSPHFFVFWKSSVVVSEGWVLSLWRGAREDEHINNNNKYDEKTKINEAFSYLFFSASRAALTTLSFFFEYL